MLTRLYMIRVGQLIIVVMTTMFTIPGALEPHPSMADTLMRRSADIGEEEGRQGRRAHRNPAAQVAARTPPLIPIHPRGPPRNQVIAMKITVIADITRAAVVATAATTTNISRDGDTIITA